MHLRHSPSRSHHSVNWLQPSDVTLVALTLLTPLSHSRGCCPPACVKNRYAWSKTGSICIAHGFQQKGTEFLSRALLSKIPFAKNSGLSFFFPAFKSLWWCYLNLKPAQPGKVRCFLQVVVAVPQLVLQLCPLWPCPASESFMARKCWRIRTIKVFLFTVWSSLEYSLAWYSYSQEFFLFDFCLIIHLHFYAKHLQA